MVPIISRTMLIPNLETMARQDARAREHATIELAQYETKRRVVQGGLRFAVDFAGNMSFTRSSDRVCAALSDR
jgi:hypothetical protein